MGQGLQRARAAVQATRATGPMPWIIHHRDGWCALPPGAVPDPDACNDPTLCGHVVIMRGGSKRGMPDCPECLSLLKTGTAPVATEE